MHCQFFKRIFLQKVKVSFSLMYDRIHYSSAVSIGFVELPTYLKVLFEGFVCSKWYLTELPPQSEHHSILRFVPSSFQPRDSQELHLKK